MSVIIVKPLEWRGGRTAKALGATWMVWPYSDPLNDGLGQWMWQVLDATPHASGRFHTIDEAKAAAQSDYEQRILSAIDLEAHKALIAAKEEERAEQWRMRREAEGSRDAARAACDSMRAERDKLREAMEGICHFADALNYRDDHLSKALKQWIAAGASALNASEREG